MGDKEASNVDGAPEAKESSARPRGGGAAVIVAGVAGAFFLAFGAWAFLAPGSFFDSVATFPPYNKHLIHDLGAFQVGLGVALLAAIFWKDSLLVALAGAAAGSAVHVFAHVLDQDLGGRGTDIPGLSLLALVLLYGATTRWRYRKA